MSELIVTRHGRVLQLTLNRPAARNALNNALFCKSRSSLRPPPRMLRSPSA